MDFLIGVVLCAATVFAQEPKPAVGKTPAAPAASPAGTSKPSAKPSRVNAVDFDNNGWPVVPNEPGTTTTTPPAAPVAETQPSTTAPASSGSASAERSTPHAAATDARSTSGSTPLLASGMEPGSPLLEVFQFTHAPGQWKAIGGVTLWWRATVYGAQGEIIGYRELTQTSDCNNAERDRIEYVNGSRIYGRSGASVFAERDGRPWPTAADAASSELALFGMHLRMPWCFGDGGAYAVVKRDVVDRPEERLQRVVIERRPAPGLEVFGPEVDPRPRDRFELIYEPTTGRPRELVHRFAPNGETRRVLLEDWAEFQGLPYPRRRVYVDANLRPTTTLELQRIEATRVSDRDFRML